MSFADVSSANIVGYQAQTLRKGFTFTVPNFVDMANTEGKSDLTHFAPGGDYESGDITVSRLDNFGRNIEDYQFLQDRDGNWYWDFEGEPVGEGDVLFTPGEGFSVDSIAGLSLTYSGEVFKDGREITLRKGFTFAGNTTPVKLDLTTIIPGGDYESGDITVSRLDNFGRNIEDYQFLQDRDGNWYWDFEGEPVGEEEVFFEPGEGFSVDSIAGLSITIPAIGID